MIFNLLFLYEILICLFFVFCELCKSIFHFFDQLLCPSYKSLNNDIVLITGASSGIGRLLCLKFAEKGCIIVGVDVHKEGLSETKDIIFDKTKKTINIFTCDIRFKENVIKLRKNIEENIGCVDILINNAGIVNGKSILDLSVDEIKETFDVNTLSNFYAVQEFLPSMLNRCHGHIVFISSIAGFITTPLLSDYCSSKAATIMLGETLLSELRQIYKNNNIFVTIVTPFLIRTGMFQGCSSRLQFLLPDLDPEYVSDKIINGVMKNQIHLSIGRIVYFLAIIKLILPVNAMYALYDYSGNFTFMNKFTNTRVEYRRQDYAKLQASAIND